MFSLKDVTTKLEAREKCTVIHGLGGVGKTTFLAEACLAKNGVMILCEDGLSTLDIEGVAIAGGVVRTWKGFMSILTALATEDHEYKVIAIDSLDKIIPALEKAVIAEHFDNDPKKGEAFKAKYGPMYNEFNRVMSAFAMLQAKGIEIMVSVHSVIDKSRGIDSEPYSFYDMALGGGAKTSLSSSLYDYCDTCMYINRGVSVINGKGTGGTLMANTKSCPSYTSKSRVKLPDSFAFSYENYKAFLEKK